MDYITTFTGKHFAPNKPLAKDTDLRDIAHALSFTARAGGHYGSFYSVAQHSLHCAYEAMERRENPRVALMCLLHDAAEAYTADLPSPVKSLVPDYKRVETGIEDVIYEKYLTFLPDEEEKRIVAEIDKALFYHEFLFHMGERTQISAPVLNSKPDFSYVNPKECEKEFLDVAYALIGQLDEMKKIRLIAMDLDGTLLRTDKTISEKLAQSLSRAAARGIEIIPASGRTFEGVPENVKRLSGVHYVIGANGTSLYRINGENFANVSMPCADAADMVRRITEKGVVAGAYIDGRGYMERAQYELAGERGTEDFVMEYFRTTRTLVDDLSEFIKEKERPVQIVTPTFHGISKDIEKEITEIPADYKDVIYVYGGPSNIDITNKDASKGAGMLEIAKRLGISAAECAAFGDSGNDAEMLKKAGFGFAMKNGDKYAYSAADFVTRSNDDDGIAYVIDKMILA